MTHRPAVVANLGLFIGFVALQVLQLAVIPLVLLPLDARWGWLLLLPVVLTNSWWAFIHEAIHGAMCTDKGWNRTAGRVHAILFGAAFDLLRWGHLLHHAFSRSPRERSEVYVPGSGPRLAVALAYYWRLLGGLYAYELIGSLLLLAPRALLRHAAACLAGPRNLFGELAGRLLDAETLRAARLDILLSLLIHGLAFAAYGPRAWMLAAALAGRALLISLMDNVFHYATPLDDTRFARNLALPHWASRLLLHFNLHGTHHRQAALPWHRLPAAHRQAGSPFHGTLVRGILAQFRGPIAESALARPRDAD